MNENEEFPELVTCVGFFFLPLMLLWFGFLVFDSVVGFFTDP